MAHAHHHQQPHHGHGHGHGHGGHGHGGHGVSGLTAHGALRISLVLTAGFMVVEALVGWLSGSLALLADAGHMLSDAGALGFALIAQRVAARGHTARATFGYRRAEVLAAFLNGIALALISIWIGMEMSDPTTAPTRPASNPTMAPSMPSTGVCCACCSR